MKKLFRSLFVLVFVFILSSVAYALSSAEKAFEEQFATIQKVEFFDPDDPDIEIVKMFYENASYTVNNTIENGNDATINITVKAIDLLAYIDDYMEKMLPLAFSDVSEEVMQESAIKYFSDLIKRSDLEYKETTFDLIMKKTGNEWVIDNPEELSSAMVAGADQIFEMDE